MGTLILVLLVLAVSAIHTELRVRGVYAFIGAFDKAVAEALQAFADGFQSHAQGLRAHSAMLSQLMGGTAAGKNPQAELFRGPQLYKGRDS